jgi:hypothetical protein
MCCLAEKGIGSVEIGEVFKNCVNLCDISVLIYDLRKRAQSKLTLCKATLWMNMVYYTDQYLLHWQSKYSLRWNKASSVNIMSVVTVSLSVVTVSLCLWWLSLHYLQHEGTRCKIHSCFSISIIEFVHYNWLKEKYGKGNSYFVKCAGVADALLLCRSNERFLGMLPI